MSMNETQVNFNLNRYLGFWYQLARIPFKWDAGCYEATAQYYKTPDGVIHLTNTCIKENGTSYDRLGLIRNPDSNQCGKLEIKFTDGLPSDTDQSPDFWAPYWVHWTDYSNFAIVGGPTKQFMWLLARRSTISKVDLKRLRDHIEKFGYDLSQIIINTDLIE